MTDDDDWPVLVDYHDDFGEVYFLTISDVVAIQRLMDIEAGRVCATHRPGCGCDGCGWVLSRLGALDRARWEAELADRRAAWLADRDRERTEP